MAKKNMVMYQGKKVPDYTVDGKGSGDLKNKKSGYGSMIKEAKYGDMMKKGGPVKTLRASSLRRCRKTK